MQTHAYPGFSPDCTQHGTLHTSFIPLSEKMCINRWPLTVGESAHCTDNPVRVLNPDRVSALLGVDKPLQKIFQRTLFTGLFRFAIPLADIDYKGMVFVI